MDEARAVVEEEEGGRLLRRLLGLGGVVVVMGKGGVDDHALCDVCGCVYVYVMWGLGGGGSWMHARVPAPRRGQRRGPGKRMVRATARRRRRCLLMMNVVGSRAARTRTA